MNIDDLTTDAEKFTFVLAALEQGQEALKLAAKHEVLLRKMTTALHAAIDRMDGEYGFAGPYMDMGKAALAEAAELGFAP